MADGTWTSAECAAAWGVKVPTWLGYVSRGQAPAPRPDGRWDPDAVRGFPRPGAGRARVSAEATALLAEMAEVTAQATAQIDALRTRQRELARAGKAAGAETRAMARALGVSPQTVYGWLENR